MALNYDEITEVLKEMEKQMTFGLFKNYAKSKVELKRMSNTIQKGCDDITHAQQNTTRQSTGVVFSVTFLKDIAASLVNMTTGIHKYDILVSRRILAYCAASIKQHV